MPDSELTDLTAVTTLGGDEVLYVVDNPGSTPVDRKVTVTNLLGTVPELAAADPTEVQLVTAANVTTLTVLTTIARKSYVDSQHSGQQATIDGHTISIALLDSVTQARTEKIVGQYYVSHNCQSAAGAAAPTLNQVKFIPLIMAAGTLDRIGVRVMTLEASSVVRLGIYGNNAGLPGTLIAEATGTIDASTTGIKELTISAVLPLTGKYWLAYVVQGASSAVRFLHADGGTEDIRLPVGTTFNIAGSLAARFQSGVTGALPANGSGINATGADTTNSLLFGYRYSA